MEIWVKGFWGVRYKFSDDRRFVFAEFEWPRLRTRVKSLERQRRACRNYSKMRSVKCLDLSVTEVRSNPKISKEMTFRFSDGE
jgi:hypothetical protein